MNPSFLGVIGPGFLNQVPALGFCVTCLSLVKSFKRLSDLATGSKYDARVGVAILISPSI